MKSLRHLAGEQFLERLRAGSAGLAGLGLGTGTALLGALALAAPFVSPASSDGLVGVLLVAGGCLDVLFSLRVVGAPARRSAYISGCLSVLMGVLVLGAPLLVGSALVLLLALSFALDGLQYLGALRQQYPDRRAMAWSLLAALGNLALAAALVLLRSWTSLALGVAGGLRLLGRASAMAVAPVHSLEDAGDTVAEDLDLPDTPEVAELCDRLAAEEAAARPYTRSWILAFGATLFAIHLGRMPMESSLLGLLGPLVAVLGDCFVALAVSFGIVVPAYVLSRRLLRGPERRAWDYAYAPAAPVTLLRRLSRRILAARLGASIRLRQSRYSIGAALERALALGLPTAAVLAATVPVWGMNWYFDTENWASGMYDSWAAHRTVAWREAMVQAVTRGEADPFGPGAFEVDPGLPDGDFSFVVIGDTGEGDSSQHILRDQLILAGLQPDVRFLVLSSDVIYPSGAIEDYEDKFYLPFKGFRHPIYAIPGNHDWYDGLEGFTANFFEPRAAAAAMRARVEADHHLTSTTDAQIAAQVAEAARLREEYQVQTGFQRAPYFQLQTGDFALIVVDTGVLKRLDPDQRRWLEAALERARDKFKMVVLGHPFYAGGHDATTGYDEFADLKALLAKHGVKVAMAGDTHDFEAYAGEGTGGMLCFVNGGGGAYLSQGTALSWPSRPAAPSWAFYPSRDAVMAKIERFTPWWKQPLWWWTSYADAWPFSAEWLSAAFDYNRSPYFQSFMEVKVLPSRNEVRLLLWGIRGPLRWSDLQHSAPFTPAPTPPNGPVEFVLPLS